MISYLTLFKCYPSTIQACRNVRHFNSLRQNQLKLVFKESNFNIVIKRRFTLNNNLMSKKAIIADNAMTSKVKLRKSDLQRLLSLAKAEKWSIIGN